MKPSNYRLNRLAPEHQHMKTHHHTHSFIHGHDMIFML